MQLTLEKNGRGSHDFDQNKRARSLSSQTRTHKGPRYLQPAKNNSVAPSSFEFVKDYSKKFRTMSIPSSTNDMDIQIKYSKTLNNQFYTGNNVFLLEKNI